MVEIQAEVPLSQLSEPPHHRSDCLAGWAPPPPTGLSRESPWGRVEKKKAEGQRGPQDFTPGEGAEELPREETTSPICSPPPGVGMGEGGCCGQR